MVINCVQFIIDFDDVCGQQKCGITDISTNVLCQQFEL